LKKKVGFIMLFIVTMTLLAGCGQPKETSGNQPVKKAPIIVATMIDSEGGILGKMIIQMLNNNGIDTVDKVNFGTPDILRKALENNEVHLVLDYTGSGQYYHPEEASDPSIWNDPQRGYERTAELDLQKNNILWLTPASANNTEMIAVKRDFAEANNIWTMADLAAYINEGHPFKLICAASFAENVMGLLGYEEAYGFKLRNDQLITLSSGNTAEMLKALYEGTNDVNASLVYGTDGALDKMNLVVLEDPKHVPPVYLPAPVIRGEMAALYPQIESILKPVFESLTLEILQNLNAQVAYDGKDAAAVAEAYLKNGGFLQ
jgi:osmoprotectant transport system substrate-binding protein